MSASTIVSNVVSGMRDASMRLNARLRTAWLRLVVGAVIGAGGGVYVFQTFTATYESSALLDLEPIPERRLTTGVVLAGLQEVATQEWFITTLRRVAPDTDGTTTRVTLIGPRTVAVSVVTRTRESAETAVVLASTEMARFSAERRASRPAVEAEPQPASASASRPASSLLQDALRQIESAFEHDQLATAAGREKIAQAVFSLGVEQGSRQQQVDAAVERTISAPVAAASDPWFDVVLTPGGQATPARAVQLASRSIAGGVLSGLGLALMSLATRRRPVAATVPVERHCSTAARR